MINPYDLVGKFRQVIDEKWGYIGGAAGEYWTENSQSIAQNKFRNGDTDYEAAAKFGRKWIGHRVSDCSGLFHWAFKELGGEMYHGQNTIWSKYTVAKGKLIGGKREDGEPLKPGTAVFKVNGDDYYHVGLYIGGNTVIEARGTQSGIVRSNVSIWNTWGELAGVDYTLTPPVAETKQVVEVSNPPVENTAKNAVAKAVAKATKEAMNAIVIATAGVNLRAEPSVDSEKLDTLKKFAQFKAEPHNDTWSKATYGDKVGYVMTKYVRIDEAAKKYLDEQKKLVANMEKELAHLKALTNIQ